MDGGEEMRGERDRGAGSTGWEGGGVLTLTPLLLPPQGSRAPARSRGTLSPSRRQMTQRRSVAWACMFGEKGGNLAA